MPDADYVLGHSPTEIRRLMLQAAILRPITDRLLREAGIGRGMRVLDLGCGAGDVSMLAAQLVGASGSVVGIDRSPEVIAIAQRRMGIAGTGQVEFRVTSLEDFSDPEPFDAVIGRYVLVHQADPAAFLSAASRFTRAGGIVAFHEIDLHRTPLLSHPLVPLWQRVSEWIIMAFHATLLHYDAALRLLGVFEEAGLRQPSLFSETPVGGGEESPFYAWMTDTLQSMLPHLLQMKMVAAEEIGIETLEERLRAAAVAARSQIECPMQICAWTRT